jgi:hypothetical protein
MPSPHPSRSALLLTSALIVLILVLSPFGPVSATHSTSAGVVPAGIGSTVTPTRTTVPAGHPDVTVPVGNRLYSTHSTLPPGVSQPGLVAVDNATGTVYSVSEDAPILVAFNAWTGAEERTLILTNQTADYYAETIALDNLTGTLYIAFVEGGPSYISVIDAATFAWVANISFAGSVNPSFWPAQEFFDFYTNQLIVENSSLQNSTDDVVAVNTTTNTFGAWLEVPCLGPAYYYFGCEADYAMFEVLDTFNAWIVILPDEASGVSSLVLSPTLSGDFVSAGFSGPGGFFFGPGAFWADGFNVTYFANVTGDGTILAFDSSGGLDANIPALVPGYPTAFTDDPATGWLGLAVVNLSSSSPGVQFDLVNPFLLTLEIQLVNSSTPYYDDLDQIAWLDAANGTGYFVTSGYDDYGSTGELIELSYTAPDAQVVETYSAGFEPFQGELLSAVDPTLGLVLEAQFDYNTVWALNENTGAVVWSDVFADTVYFDWITVDAAGGIAYLTTFEGILGLNAATGAVDVNMSLSWEDTSASYGFGQILYVLDVTNQTVQLFSNAGGATSLVADGQINLPIGSDAYYLSASPTAEVVADEDYTGGPYNDVQVSTVAAGSTVTNLTGLYDVSSLAFNATGALFVGNGTTSDTQGNITVWAPNTWTLVRTVPSPIPVYDLYFDPAVNALLVTGPNSEVDLLNATTGHLLTTFNTAGFLEVPSVDASTGSIAVPGSTGETLLANLVPLPDAASGLAVTPGNGTLAVSWTAATGASGYPVTGYVVYTGSSAAGPWTQVGSRSTATSATLTGLTDGTTYFVTVRATSGSGTSPAATAVSGVPVGVPYPPTGLAVTAPTSSTLAVGWGAPSSDGGAAISGYTVLYATTVSGPWTSQAAGTATNATLTHLASGTTYFVKVEAANSVGTGNPSASAQGTTSGSSSNSSSGGLPGGSWLWIAIAVVIVVIVVALLAALMMRRGKSSPPGGSPPGAQSGPGAPPSGAAGGTPPPPPPGAQ